MLDEPKTDQSSPPGFESTGVDADRAFEDYRSYLLSPEFKRRVCEHFRKATRRAIEEGRHLESELHARAHP
jgi:hypothetical protein